MTYAIADAAQMTRRWLMALVRQPVWIGVTLIQPVVWLLLFGPLFEKVTEIPGFEASNYHTFLAPGIIVMTAVFSAGWNGMGMIEDMDKGVMDRFLVSPVHRTSLILGPVAQCAIVTTIQSLIIVGLALIVGATFPGGVGGVVLLIVAAVLIACALAAFSNAIALVTRQEETLIGIVQFIVLPLTFLSAAFMQLDLAPGWMQDVAQFNPVNWAVEAAREAVAVDVDWGFVLVRLGLLAALAAIAVYTASRAFKAYQKSV